MATYLTKNFTLEELIRSATADRLGIRNYPNSQELSNLKALAKLLQKIRDRYGKAIWVSSGFRCRAVNTAVGGSKTSQHMVGQAADIKACKGSTNKKLFELIKQMIDNKELTVGQLIWEYGNKKEPQWVHVSTPYTKINNILYIYK